MSLRRAEKVVMETDRLILRLPHRRDEVDLARFYAQNRDFLQPFSPIFNEELFTVKGWRRRVEATLAEYKAGRGLRLVLFLRGTPTRIVGVVNFTSITSFPSYMCNLGYSVAEGEQGNGYMTEALRGAIGYVFSQLHLHRIEANYMPHNAASARVLEKLGFSIEGHASEYLLIDGKWETHVRTSLNNPNWHPPS